ncbi:hypothetical protein B0H13DRAFT_1639833 [Mycena leptocephala]|nr:hypothetical protein B0H13DRAFT_1639833 [Mycena leptocephala]
MLLLESRKRKAVPLRNSSRSKVPRLSFETSASSIAFPIILSQGEKDEIVHEFCAATNNALLKRYECSFCGKFESADRTKIIPLRSYANGFWIGKVPEELQNLTFLEEQCIARARATRCMYKLTLGPTSQLAARGNVCILV